MSQVNIKSFKKSWFTFEETQRVIKAEENYNKTKKSYSIEEAFNYIDSKLVKSSNKCTK